jgi:hypothetical protein
MSSFTVSDDCWSATRRSTPPGGGCVAAPLATPTPERWRTVVAESDDVIEGVAVTAGSLLVASTRRATCAACPGAPAPLWPAREATVPGRDRH